MKIITLMVLIMTLTHAEDSKDISFMYGFVGNLKPSPDVAVELFDSSIVHTKDDIIINAGYANNSYFYLIHVDSKGNYDLLYKSDVFKVSNNGNQTDTLYRPVFQGRLIQPPGDETFYLINSRTALTELIGLFGQYNNDKTPIKRKAKLSR